MRFSEFKLNEGMHMKDEILQRLLKWQTSKRLQYGSRNFSVGGKSFGRIPAATINDIFYDLGMEGIGYSAGTQNYAPLKRAAKAASDLITRVAAASSGPSKSLKRDELAGFADDLYSWYEFAHQRMDAGIDIHDMSQSREDAIALGVYPYGKDAVTEAPAKPKAKPKTKAEIEKLRLTTQAGTITQRQAFSIKKQLVGVIGKYAKGEDWEVKQSYLDAGLYYVGSDLNEANRIGKEIVGALYGYFQDGARRTVTKLKREEDDQMMTFTAMPTPDKFLNKNPPQLSFTWHKNAVRGGPVIAININATR